MSKRLLPIFILIAYSALLVKLMVLKDMPTVRIGHLMLNFSGTTDGSHPANFVPFATIVPYLLGHKGLIIAGVNLVGNIALLVPIGFLAPFIYRNITWKKSLAIALASGLAIEMLQTALRVGIFDIDDVLLNALGVMIGYWAFIIFAKWMRERKYMNMVIVVFLIIAAAAGALYAIYPHGQPMINPGTGDLCNDTGGTGQIVSRGNHTITIKRKDGFVQTINLAAQTTIRTSSGSASETDLKMGDRVTVVVNEDEIASAVLVCSS